MGQKVYVQNTLTCGFEGYCRKLVVTWGGNWTTNTVFHRRLRTPPRLPFSCRFTLLFFLFCFESCSAVHPVRSLQSQSTNVCVWVCVKWVRPGKRLFFPDCLASNSERGKEGKHLQYLQKGLLLPLRTESLDWAAASDVYRLRCNKPATRQAIVCESTSNKKHFFWTLRVKIQAAFSIGSTSACWLWVLWQIQTILRVQFNSDFIFSAFMNKDLHRILKDCQFCSCFWKGEFNWWSNS